MTTTTTKSRDLVKLFQNNEKKMKWEVKDLDFTVFPGAWSYCSEEMRNAVSCIQEKKSLNILEFGCGVSTIKLFNLLSKKWEIKEYKCFETNQEFLITHPQIDCILYHEKDIQSLDIGDTKYDFILIDGPNGVSRKYWYSKITANVKSGTVILIDDWCHYEEFELCLVNDFGSKVNFKIKEERNESYKSWKIIEVT
jgi:predicted O-methyltransferase YrrM